MFTERFVPPLVVFSKNGQNLVFNHISVHFKHYKCLFISSIAFTIALRQIYIFKKSCNIALRY